MSQVDIEQVFTIHLGVNDDQFARLEADARSRGMSVFDLDLSPIANREALCDYLADIFAYPHKTRGLDAAVDLIGDLEWFGNDRGHLIIARGLTKSTVADSFVSILPSIVDRWRSQSIPFIVAIDGKDEHLQSELSVSNSKLDRFGRHPWVHPGTGAVDVVIH